jgi:predicted nucleotide-binding protein
LLLVEGGAMELDELKAFLDQRQVGYVEKDVQNGTQLICKTPQKETFNHYTKSGKVVIGGKPSVLSQAVQAWKDSGFTPATVSPGDAGATPASTGALNRDIFVVYGHDEAARKDLELLLHRMDLNPIVLANLTPDGDTIIEKLEKYLGTTGNVGFACVLVTPDDEGHAKSKPDEKKYRARQNVILELGMVLGRLGRKRVAILRKASVEEPSDISGLVYIPFAEDVAEVKSNLFAVLDAAGYHPNKNVLT